jgi:hypothetical protein
MKSPPEQFTDDEAREKTEDFIREHARKTAKEPSKTKA